MSKTSLLISLVAIGLSLAGPGAHGKDPRSGLIIEFISGIGQEDPAAAYDEAAAEIVAYDKRSERLFVVNGNDKAVDIIDISNVKSPRKLGSIDVAGDLGNGFIAGGANSVAVAGEIVAVAIEADEVTDPGAVGFYDTDGNLLNLVRVGALPDMLTFTPDGEAVLVANEGEPEGGIDSEGTVSVIDIRKGVLSASVRTADFSAFDSQAAALRAAGVRLFPGVPGDITVSQDLEPEYIAVDSRGRTAFVTLQEANSFAVLDIRRAKITAVLPLGTKDHSLAGNGMDVSDDDAEIIIEPQPVRGLYMPDAIASYKVRGRTYYITANEGDDRGDADEGGRGDVIRFKDIEDVTSFGRSGLAASDDLQATVDALSGDQASALGRLNISTIDGIDENGDLNQLFSYGARSFTIWNAGGELVWDSGDLLEQLTAAMYPDNFNASNTNNEIDNRSDNKGPEPEAVAIARLFGDTYAFIGLERIGGVAVFNVGNPDHPTFIDYINNRDFSFGESDYEAGDFGGDLGPEGILVIDKDDSPAKTALLVIANEISGTTSIFSIEKARKKKGHNDEVDD